MNNFVLKLLAVMMLIHGAVAVSFWAAVEPQIISPTDQGELQVLLKAFEDNNFDDPHLLNNRFHGEGGQKGWVEGFQDKYIAVYYDPCVGRMVYKKFESKIAALQKLKEELLRPHPAVCLDGSRWKFSREEVINQSLSKLKSTADDLLTNKDFAQALDAHRIDSESLLNKFGSGGMGRRGWIDRNPNHSSKKYIMVRDDYLNGYVYEEFNSAEEALKALRGYLWPMYSSDAAQSGIIYRGLRAVPDYLSDLWNKYSPNIIEQSRKNLQSTSDFEYFEKLLGERMVDNPWLLNTKFYGKNKQLYGWIDKHPDDNSKYIMVYQNPWLGFEDDYQEFDSKADALQALKAALFPDWASKKE